jgi:hypothetical protein
MSDGVSIPILVPLPSLTQARSSHIPTMRRSTGFSRRPRATTQTYPKRYCTRNPSGPANSAQQYRQSNRCRCCKVQRCNQNDACDTCCEAARGACQYYRECDTCKFHNIEGCDGETWCNNCQADPTSRETCRRSCVACWHYRTHCDGWIPVCSPCRAMIKVTCDGKRSAGPAQG